MLMIMNSKTRELYQFQDEKTGEKSVVLDKSVTKEQAEKIAKSMGNYEVYDFNANIEKVRAMLV